MMVMSSIPRCSDPYNFKSDTWAGLRLDTKGTFAISGRHKAEAETAKEVLWLARVRCQIQTNKLAKRFLPMN